MPKALFFNIPGHGHVNPSLPMVAELVRRGHQITYFDSEGYRPQIEAAGATFQPYEGIPDDYFEGQGLHGGVPQKVMLALISTTREILPELLEQARAAQLDYIIYDSMCPWGYFVGQILKVPTVVSYALMPASSGLRPLLNVHVVKAVFPTVVKDIPNGIRANRLSRVLGKQYGVKALSGTEFAYAPGDFGISYSTSYFAPFAKTVLSTIHFVGRVLDDTPQDPTFSFEQVKDRRLIYVSMGTVNNGDVEFFRACIEAFGNSDNYVIISTGKRVTPETFGALPENIEIYPWVPQLDVLRRASLFISHGGLGGIHDGLYFGVPMLLIPQVPEQAINSMRVVELGAGVKLNKNAVTPDSLRWYRSRLLNEPDFKTQAQKIGDTFREAGGAPKAADLIEAFLGERKITVA